MLRQTSRVVEQAEELAVQLSHWRRSLHANPELSFREHNTAAYIVNALQSVEGISIRTGIAGTGIVASLGTGSGPVIALRADMDALPIFEENSHAYRSRIPGVMHACGHDAHTAILLGAAHLLSRWFADGELTGTVRFIFQPAEEAANDQGVTGAPYMIQAGAFDEVTAAIALHVNPEAPVGEIWVHDGYSMANVDNFSAVIKGSGGHAAYPHLTTDPTWILLPVLQALHGIVARRVSPLQEAVVSVGQIHAGTSANVIPTLVALEGTLRSYRPDVRESIISELERALSVARVFGGDYEFQVVRGEPALNNHPKVNEAIKSSIEELYPQCVVTDIPFGLGGEDFGHVSARVPSAMFFLGCGLQDGAVRGLHTPQFDVDERCLSMGSALLVETTCRLLRGDIVIQPDD
ncbi:amidohydrolase [Alicyclobacillus fastidiosus]|uniref:Amidohydrolase n=1 Tax=Alicyclobacillus fastidiosus TaxID=392011 RepID=A0ABY6ZAM8_9BACL|nr:amidohydrolase [Alicyclobacillus fastidiosus]WAH39934.1 amidohydrolase [Alicyclobacillus fastidiosus]GMA61214.1 amidohydrolase [Alicyclobacillus fastidiosus]